MKKIKIINGTYGFRPEPLVVECKTPADPPFYVEDQEAIRLVNLGVAEYVGGVQCKADASGEGDDEQYQGDTGENGGEVGTPKLAGHLDAEQLEGMDYNELKKLAADMGVEPEGKKKSDYIAAIVAANVEIDDEDAGEGDDELPELNAADPE